MSNTYMLKFNSYKERILNESKKRLDLNIKPGDICLVTYKTSDSERNFTLEGVCTAFRKNGIASNIRIKKESKDFIFVQTFLIYSKDVISIEKIGSLKITSKRKNKLKRAKLYYYEKLKGKSAKI